MSSIVNPLPLRSISWKHLLYLIPTMLHLALDSIVRALNCLQAFMPPIRTASDDNKPKEHPSPTNMFVFVSRVQPYRGLNWNAQFQLWQFDDKSNRPWKRLKLRKIEFRVLRQFIERDLDVDIALEDPAEFDITWCLVWRMSESGRLGRIIDDDSFLAAVEDHRRAYKNTLDLYVIRWLV
ncbi:unnamed protein product [Aureobasidium mustum]|uniref:Uncharacterized protein n=1 Tax=Aureobasidium mustum TaxID=2773714 RepID=A0A9N8PFG2_9PEZI|nr:unnamed protein product [Aureobasidium mustum]